MNRRSDWRAKQISQFPPNQTVQHFFPPSKRCCFTQYKRLLFSPAVIPLQLLLPSSMLSLTPFSFPVVSFSPFISKFFFIIFYFYFLIRPSPLLFILFYHLLSFPIASFSPYLSRFFLYLFIFITLLVNLHYYFFYFILVIF